MVQITCFHCFFRTIDGVLIGVIFFIIQSLLQPLPAGHGESPPPSSRPQVTKSGQDFEKTIKMKMTAEQLMSLSLAVMLKDGWKNILYVLQDQLLTLLSNSHQPSSPGGGGGGNMGNNLGNNLATSPQSIFTTRQSSLLPNLSK